MVGVTHLLEVLKVVFLLCLVSVCFFHFSFPAIKRFLDQKIIINESVEKYNALRPPVITICPKKWKQDSVPHADTTKYERYCGNASTAEDYEACVTNETYGFKEIIQNATRGIWLSGVDNLTDPQLWTWDVTFTAVGRCFTLNYHQLLRLNLNMNGILLRLQKNDYYVYLSGPDFFFTATSNPLTMPVTMVTLHGNESGVRSVFLKMARTEELNRPEAP